MNDQKYSYLVNVLDKIALMAPDEFTSYDIEGLSEEKINQVRSKTYIHLILQSRFGITSFIEREKFITDGTNDGGVDAYYLDYEYRTIYFIQSKFRTKRSNFEEKELRFEELLSMEIDRILAGEKTGCNDVTYNGKILNLIREIKKIQDIARYQYKVIIVANTKEISPDKLFKLSGGFPTEVINHEKCYSQILFPVLTGSYFSDPHLFIHLNLSNKQSGTKISYSVETSIGSVDITVVFVPTLEIAKTLSKYKNSILKYNPRCYLDLEESQINPEIMNTITGLDTNEFALFNNGITILSEETSINERIGIKDKAQLLIKNPQIINGGQTAFALSRILLENPDNPDTIFLKKEVLVKIITLDESLIDKDRSVNLIESISNATNQQNLVTYADRHSNDIVQLNIQKLLYQKYGVLYERKRGEFADAQKYKYINKSSILNRSELLRISRALKGDLKKKQSGKRHYNDKKQYNLNFQESDIDSYYFGFICLRQIAKYLNRNKSNSPSIDRALRFGPYFIIFILSKIVPDEIRQSVDDIKQYVDDILSKWIDFEKYIIGLPVNGKYFKKTRDRVTDEEKNVFLYKTYYRTNQVLKDLEYFFIKQKNI